MGKNEIMNRDDFIKFVDKFGMWIFAIWIFLVALLVMNSINAQTVDKVRLEINKYDINEEHKDIILAQSILESGWYKSYWCKNHNNIFGLTKRIKDTRGPQVFKTWEECVQSYYYQIYMKYTRLKRDKDYYAFLVDLPYAMDPLYVSKLKKIVNTF